LRSPFSITLSGRIAVGGQPMISNRGFGTRGPGGFAGGFDGGPDGGRGGMEARMGGMLRGGAEGLDIGALMRGTSNIDSLLSAVLTNPVHQVLALRDSIALTPEQTSAITLIADTVDAQMARRRAALEPVVRQVVASAAGRPNPQQLGQQIQLEIQPHIAGSQREAAEAMATVQRSISAEQWQKLPESLRATGQQQQRGSFNAVGFLDRMLVNPLPVLLELRDTLGMTAEQITQIEKISSDLQILLAKRREDLGRRFDSVQQGAEQGRIFQELQPEIQKTREEITDALESVRKVLSRAQWERVPEQIRNPFQPQRGGRRGGM
jgi:hypothetical protein